ncbi:hypothetical protein, partial [Hoeflea sp.]|uniref:hypothetical protein n=1 Tax=Hoeflea sp. TaxID=1940281 RepID=UPI0025BE421D
ARNGPGAQSQRFAWGRQSPLKTRLFPRRDGRLSVFATGMMAERMGLTSNLLHYKLLILHVSMDHSLAPLDPSAKRHFFSIIVA